MSEHAPEGSSAPHGAAPVEGDAAGAHPGRPLLEMMDLRQLSLADDINFVKKNWMRIHRQWVPRLMDSDTYYYEQERLIGKLGLTAEAWVACDKEHPFYIYGFVVGNRTETGEVIVHFVFTRDEWRNRGVARLLLNHLGWKQGKKLWATHWSNFIKPHIHSKYSIGYNPYILPSTHA